MTGGVITLDLHGKNQYQARIAIDAQLRRAKAGTYRLRLIHGGNHGTALRDMILSGYAGDRRVLRLESPSSGVTELVLREY